MVKKKIQLSIIVPIYNEEGNIKKLTRSLLYELSKCKLTYEIIYIDDGSQDRSLSILLDEAKKNNSIKVIKFRKNFGQTAALMAGINHSVGEIIIPMDGDLQNDPSDIVNLIKKLKEGYDVVSGWRSQRRDSHLSRKLPSYIANKLISYISGIKLNDFGCTLKAYRRSVISGVRLYGEMHRFIPIYASWYGAKVTEIPVKHHPRESGKSKYGINRTFKVILDLLVIKFFENYSTKPIYIFGGFGVLLILLSFSILFLSLYLKFFQYVSLIQTPLPLLSGLCFILGVLSILLGFIAELIIRIYFESQNKEIYLIESIKN